MYRNNKIIFHLLSSVCFCLGIVGCEKKSDIPFATPSFNIAENSTFYTTPIKPYGLINQSDAAALYNAYQQSQQNETQTQFVSFKIKDLLAYLNMLSSKYQQEEVFVNFGQYSEQTSTDPNKIGRNTIFFSGNLSFQNNHATEMIHSKTTNDCLEYLNHGQLYP
jgi:hypothetical protein